MWVGDWTGEGLLGRKGMGSVMIMKCLLHAGRGSSTIDMRLKVLCHVRWLTDASIPLAPRLSKTASNRS